MERKLTADNQSSFTHGTTPFWDFVTCRYVMHKPTDDGNLS